MPVLNNDPGPFWRSLCPFYKTTPARFGGRYARSAKRPRPVLAVVMPVLKNDPSPFWRSFSPFCETTRTRFDRRFGSTVNPVVGHMQGINMGIYFQILFCLLFLDIL
jgi:hypothetical protein